MLITDQTAQNHGRDRCASPAEEALAPWQAQAALGSTNAPRTQGNQGTHSKGRPRF